MISTQLRKPALLLRLAVRQRLPYLLYGIIAGLVATVTAVAEMPAAAAIDNRVRVLLVATEQAVLSSQISGKISQLTTQQGDWFKQGEALVKLDCGMQQAEQQIARAKLKKTRHQLEVQKQLDALHSGSRLNLHLAKANVDQAIAELRKVEINLEFCSIRAPFDGRVVERHASAFQNIAAGQPVMEIINNNSLEVKLIVPSLWLSWIRTGETFKLTLDETQQDYSASVTRIGANVDPASQSITLFGKIEGKHPHLVAGMSGFAIFNSPHQNQDSGSLGLYSQ